MPEYCAIIEATMVQNTYILGINESHVASAAILCNGKILACISEERLTRKKGQWGYPKRSIEFCLQSAGIAGNQLAGVYLGFKDPTLFIHQGTKKVGAFAYFIHKVGPVANRILQNILLYWPGFYVIYEGLRKYIFGSIISPGLDRSHKRYIADDLGVPPDRVFSVDHHCAHAFAGYYGNPDLTIFQKNSTLVISNDGIGDDVCSRIFTVVGQKWREVSSTPNENSLGWLYLFVTEYLGMKPNEHEYKVMGLAPYSSLKAGQEVAKIFSKLMWVDGLVIKSALPMLAFPGYIRKYLSRKRFDHVASGIQQFTEETLVSLVKNSIAKTGIRNLVLAGGIFMNVKANMEIAARTQVKRIFVTPSCGDESTAIGAAYYGYKRYCENVGLEFDPLPIDNLYLGPQYSDRQIYQEISRLTGKLNKGIRARKLKSPSREIAALLARGEVVARFAGKMEFGARALGNRSILANPMHMKVVRVINDQIKSRDFWMPFAPVILQERSAEYLVNPKKIDSRFMMIGFNTTEKAKIHLAAALHPYDGTARPQIITESTNPDYYAIIKEFEKITGIGGLLNTSFNLHGEPIVCTPENAIKTFLVSGLKYLQLGEFLLEKN